MIKIAISIEESLVKRVDELVRKHVYKNRSQAIQAAVLERIERFEHTRLAIECAKLIPNEEQDLADEGLSGDSKEWPAF